VVISAAVADLYAVHYSLVLLLCQRYILLSNSKIGLNLLIGGFVDCVTNWSVSYCFNTVVAALTLQKIPLTNTMYFSETLSEKPVL